MLLLQLALWAPFVAGCFVLFAGSFVSRKVGLGVVLSLQFTAFFLSMLLCLSGIFIGDAVSVVSWFQWFCLDGFFNLEVSWRLDNLVASMFFLVTTVSFFVNMFSVYYMKDDPRILLFFGYLSMFTFFMLVAVASNNFIQFFLGWEGIGLCSFLLISFWYERVQAVKSALKAMIVNRVGDVILLVAFSMLFKIFGTFNYTEIFNIIQILAENDSTVLQAAYLTDYKEQLFYLEFAAFILFLGTIAKSAQFGLHAWLPDAMEGPTPVSALIHAATMVTAGVFLVIRCSPIFELVNYSKIYIPLFGGFTCLYAGYIACYQFDLKKLIAYSTMSQLGYMMLACGVSSYTVGFFHLWIHGFVKALLFLSSGVIIHAFFDEQSMFRMGGAFRSLPFTTYCFIIGSVSLMAVPLFSGFYSKDLLLELVYSSSFSSVASGFIFISYFMGIISSACTGYYSTKLFIMVFFDNSGSSYKKLTEVHDEKNIWVFSALGFLAFASIFFGRFFSPIIVNPLSTFFKNSVYVHTYTSLTELQLQLAPLVQLLPIILTVVGVLVCLLNWKSIMLVKPASSQLSWWLQVAPRWSFDSFLSYNVSLFMRTSYLDRVKEYVRMPVVFNQENFNQFYLFTLVSRKFFFDKIVNEYLSVKLLRSSFTDFFKLLDKGLFEYFGPLGISTLVKRLSMLVIKLQTGLVYNYVCTITLAVIVLLASISLT